MRAVLIAAVAFVLAGCAASGVQVSQQAANQFKEGVTTEAEILKTLGRPTFVTTAGGIRQIGYSGSQYQVKPATYIPIVGMFAGGADYSMSSVVYQIRPDGVLDVITYTQIGGGSRAGTTPADMPATEPRAVQ